MQDFNFTGAVESNFYQFDLPLYNSSIFFDVNGFNGAGRFVENVGEDNATHHILTNGTRTKVPKKLFAPIRSPFVVKLSFYTCPLIVVVGLLSNMLAYLVFTRTRLRRVPSVPYLAAMAVVDSGALVTEFIQHGLMLHGVFIISWNCVCQYTTYFNFIFIFLCIWYPVALCVEKFICVYFPLRKAALCTTFRAKVVIIGMMVMAATCYYYVIYMTGPVGQLPFIFCTVWDVFLKEFTNLMRLDGIFVIVLPNITLIVLMILICGRGCEYYRISSAVDVTNRSGSTRNSSLCAPIRVTNVIFPVVFFVLILKLPIGIMRLYWSMSKPVSIMSPTLVELQRFFIYVARFEWVVKLYLYLIFSPSFRRRTKSLFFGIRAKLKHKCRSSLEEIEIDGIPVTARIKVPVREDRDNSPRTCLMVSDV